ncbi:hypothetical protein B0T19DRAFT_481401 [Cercophora scortea]|uniref:Pre-mRNA-splicing factor CWC24 n=1 Tax=Cercophora scortea TaxID=314031 RepID=A0AAE0MLK2_9PEZI|nr:hypothetical protein B0T19DRAFT_481401 [Cercophora scortea]
MIMADSAAAAAPVVALFKKRGAKGKANIRKRPATPPPPADSDDDDDDSSDLSSSEDESGARIKRRKKNGSGPVVASSRNHASSSSTDKDAAIARQTIFEADRTLKLDSSNDATKMVDWFDQEKEEGGELSAKSLLGRTRAARPSQPAEQGRGEALDGTYKGMANRATYIQKNPNAPNRTVGPIKAPTNIRTITIVDMAPDVCKDYKQTGFCGFGDNCKFLHAREDYQHGWQLDKEWETVTKGKKVLGGTVVASADRRNTKTKDDDDDKQAQEDEEEAMLDNIPFVCILCKGAYKAPVVTRCGHYFCEACALKRYRSRDPGCAACGAATNGVFNAAKKLQKLLDRKREKGGAAAAAARARQQEAIEAGEEDE